MANSDRTVVYGYMREMENILSGQIIPVNIIELCLLFYLNAIKMFLCPFDQHEIYYYVNRDDNKVKRCKKSYIGKQSDYSINTDAASCFIPNISSIIKIPSTIKSIKGKCDGILSYATNSISFRNNKRYTLNLINCDDLCSNNNNEEIKYYPNISKPISTTIMSSFLYCDSRNGIISPLYESYKSPQLRQLKFCDIKLNEKQIDCDIPFKRIGNMKQLSAKNHTLSIGYIDYENKLFCIDCTKYVPWGKHDSLQKQKQIFKFGIFDINEKKFVLIKESEFMVIYSSGIKACIAQNNGFDSNKIFINLNNTWTNKYDVNKDKFILLNEIVPINQSDIVSINRLWLNEQPSILNCFYQNIKDEFGFKIIDIRSDNMEWIHINDMKYCNQACQRGAYCFL